MPTACVLSVILASLAAAPLTAGKDGTLLRDGKPFRAIGINYFSAFSRTLQDPKDTSYLKGFDVLKEHGIPFIRFMAGGFWPKDWTLYRENPVAYFQRLDAFVKAAEEKGIGLIPSVCWYDACIPDLVGESRNQWGNRKSKTVTFMRHYAAELSARYGASPAIWAWELGNEYSLGADLPNADTQRPPIHPDLGTRTQRSAEDDLTHDMVVTASREFAGEIYRQDAVHPITTGHSLPRPSAQHQRTEHSWTADSKDEFVKNLIDVTPDPANLISVHMYPFDKKGRFGQEVTPYVDTLKLCQQAAAKAGKAVFVGEFGAPDSEKDGGPDLARKEVEEMIAAIEASGVALAALWVFDLSDQDGFINVAPTNQRSYLLDELGKANQRQQGR